MSDLDDVLAELNQIDRRLAEIEAHQWTANGRLRQDTAGLTHDIGVLALLVIAVWVGAPFQWWYLVVAGMVLPFSRSHVIDRAWKQEQVRNGALR